MRVDQPFEELRTILRIQAGVVILITIAAWWVWTAREAQAAFYGGLIGFIPNAYLAFRIIRTKGGAPRQIVKAFYRGELVKFLLTAVLFFGASKIPGLSIMPLLIGFIAVMSVFWFSLLLVRF